MALDVLNHNRRTTFGFGGTPVAKFLIGFCSTSHVFTMVPMFAGLAAKLRCQIPKDLQLGELWRIIVSKFVFLDTKDAIFCLILFYQFRIFERRFGSRKFASHLLCTSFLTMILEVLFTLGLQHYTSDRFPLGRDAFLSSGPFGMIIPWFVFYYKDIPSFGSQGAAFVSGKTLNYFLGLQIAALSQENVNVFVSAILSGLLVKVNFLWIRKWLKVPKFISQICDKAFGWVISSPISNKDLLGATLEIQRTEQMEQLEQSLIRQQQRVMNDGHRGGEGRRVQRRVGQGYEEQLVNPNIAFFGGGGNVNRRDPSDQNIQTLMDMGFSRDRVVAALRQTEDDVQSATAILLQGFQN